MKAGDRKKMGFTCESVAISNDNLFQFSEDEITTSHFCTAKQPTGTAFDGYNDWTGNSVVFFSSRNGLVVYENMN